MKPEDIPPGLVQRAIAAYEDTVIKGGNFSEMTARAVLAATLPVFDKMIRTQISEWIEAQMHKCPYDHDRDTGHKVQCNWCWQNSALRNAARLAQGEIGSTTGYALLLASEAEAAS